jgi:DNA-binding ferritin-like protein
MSEALKEEERDYEAEARSQGWAPEENWKGDPDKFKSAEQFVKDGENIPAILKSKVERLESRVEQLLDSNKQFNEFSQRSLEKEKKEKEQVIQELQEARKQAVNDGDGDAFDRADKQLDELKTAPIETQGIDPMAKDWLSHNTWYETNATLAAFADGMADRLIAQGYTGKAYFDELTERTKEAFPEEFGNKNRKKPNLVEDGEPAVVDSSKQTFNNLPKEAKEAYANFKRDIPGFTKEQFVEQYDWE